jgi:predicted N-acetyltransferase YhbS
MSTDFESDVVGPRTPVVREATEDDQEQVDALLRAAFGRRDAAIDTTVGGRDLVAVEPDHAPGDPMRTQDSGRVVGYLGLTPVEDRGRPALAVSTLAVLPERQHRGIATHLVQFALEAVADTEGTPLVLSDEVADSGEDIWRSLGLHRASDPHSP